MTDALAKELAQRFGLGPSARPLLSAFIAEVTARGPEGWEWVLERFRRIGFGTEVATWLGAGPNQSIPPEAVEEAFGRETLDELADRVGVNPRTASEALAFAIPQLIDSLDGEPLENQVAPHAESNVGAIVRERPASYPAWVTPLSLTAIVSMIAFASFMNRPVKAAVSPLKPAVLSETVERSTIQLAPATLLLKAEREGLTYEAVVRDKDDAKKLEATLEKLGATGTIEVDLGVERTDWSPAIEEILRDAPRGLEMTFENYRLTLSGMNRSELEARQALLSDRLSSQFSVAVLDLEKSATSANESARSALSALSEIESPEPQDLVDALNKMVINFRSGSVQIPEVNRELLALVAAKMPPVKVVVSGYTDSTGSASGNERLSQRRAEEIVEFLVSEGADAEFLEARGMGAANPIASNDTEAGRFANRRIEFSIEAAP